jgi:hypothetical protein
VQAFVPSTASIAAQQGRQAIVCKRQLAMEPKEKGAALHDPLALVEFTLHLSILFLGLGKKT